MICIDFETRSRADLKRLGGRAYAAHPSTEITIAVLHDMRTGELETWAPGEPRPALLDRHPYAAHNAVGFDRFIAARFWGVPLDYPWIDTAELARVAGLPGSLDQLGLRLFGRHKDKAGNALTRSLSGAQVAGVPEELKALVRDYRRACKDGGAWPPIPQALAERNAAYCADDVEIMSLAWPELEEFDAIDRDVRIASRRIEDRGVCFDADLARALLDADAKLVERTLAACAIELGMTVERVREVAGSPAQCADILGLPNAQKATLEGIDHPLVKARQALASIVRGKLEAGLARVGADGILRDNHRYYAAHTGRWGGQGLQLQNLPRPAARFEAYGPKEIDALISHVMHGGDLDGDEIAFLLRAVLHARPGRVLVVRDFKGIEARVNAWSAGDSAALGHFRADADIYRVMAAEIWPEFRGNLAGLSKVQRTVGKQAELMLGYQAGAGKFGQNAANAGVDLDAMGIDAIEVTQAWRRLHKPIVDQWYALDRAWKAAATHGDTCEVGPYRVVPSDCGRHVAIFLPSGRPIVYREARVFGDGWGARGSYHGARGREEVYGGKLCENITQALARDLMACALVRAEEIGLEPVIHVHDEIVCDIDECMAEEGGQLLDQAMLDQPEAAQGLPLAVDGHEGFRYRK